MHSRSFTTRAEQVAEKILNHIRDGHWKENMPGSKTLANEFGVNHKTCESALKLLENKGVLVPQGRGLGRRIASSISEMPKKLRVKLLLYNKAAAMDRRIVELIHRLREDGHEASCSEMTLCGMQMKANRVARYVEKTDADAWIVLAGSHEVLEWFASTSIPVFALYGRLTRVSMASFSVTKIESSRQLIERLVELGHRRIVLITAEDRRKPTPGYYEKCVLEVLEEYGMKTSDYNLPNWGNRPEELRDAIKSLFKFTPPSAIIVDESSLFFATMQQLARLKVAVPEQVSMACLDWNPVFRFACPAITHLQWNDKALYNRITKWIQYVSIGKRDLRKTSIKAKLHLGGTIGPAPGESERT